MSDAYEDWLASRETTNKLLAFGIVVVAAGFVSVGDVGPAGIRLVSELLLVLVLVGAIVLVLALLVRDGGS